MDKKEQSLVSPLHSSFCFLKVVASPHSVIFSYLSPQTAVPEHFSYSTQYKDFIQLYDLLTNNPRLTLSLFFSSHTLSGTR